MKNNNETINARLLEAVREIMRFLLQVETALVKEKVGMSRKVGRSPRSDNPAFKKEIQK